MKCKVEIRTNFEIKTKRKRKHVLISVFPVRYTVRTVRDLASSAEQVVRPGKTSLYLMSRESPSPLKVGQVDLRALSVEV